MKVREVFPDIYINEIPLPGNPLKLLNSYIIVSDQRTMIIDTGFNMDVCKDAFLHGVEELGADLTKTDLVLTHMHVDHIGLANELTKLGVTLYIGPRDGEIVNRIRRSDRSVFQEMNEALGLSADVNPNNFGFGQRTREVLQYKPLVEGDVLQIGRYVFEVIDIPGHSPGHICLYDRTYRILFSGDHILNEISPNITSYDFVYDYLGIYLASLDKIHALDIDYIFSGHRSIICDHRQRIAELKAHHQDRLNEILQILGNGKKTIRETASKMHWDLSYATFEDFPGTQKWFASGEAMAHLQHLVTQGLAHRIEEQGTIFYELA